MTAQVSSLLNDDNMLNFMVALILENQTVYNSLFEILKESQNSEIERTRMNMQILKDYPPSFFNVPEKFALNFQTYQYLKGITTFVDIPPYSKCVR